MQPIVDYTSIIKKTLKSKEIWDLDGLWQDYLTSRSIEARNKLIHKYLPFVKVIAGRISMGIPDSMELDDLVSAGIVGLIEAIDRYDPGRKVKFETFAYTRIRGAIVDELRRYDWFPRSVRAINRELEATIEYLEGKLQRYPTDEEIAEQLGISLDEYYQMVKKVNASYILSLDGEIEQSDGESALLIDIVVDESSPSAEEEITRNNVYLILRNLVDNLPEKEKLILALYYYEGLTLKEIGAVLDISESRVSQIHGKVIAYLRGKVKRYLKM